MKRLGLLLTIGATLAVAPAAEAQPKAETPRASLTSADPVAGVAAARALASSKARGALDQLLDGLASGLHPQVAAAALDAVAAHGKPVAYDTVVFYLHHRTPKVRAAAVRAVAAVGGKRAPAHVLAALRDGHRGVRAAAAKSAAELKLKRATEPLLALLRKGDEAAAPALSALGDVEVARAVGELIGKAPDALVARTLGSILLRADFKPEDARVQVVRALGKVPGNEALEQLTTYVGAVPENPPRQSRREAEAIIEQRLGGG